MYKVVEITTPTCSVCKMLKPMISKVLESYPNVTLCVVDHEDSDIQYFLKEFSIKSVPAFFFVKEGETVDTHFGAITMPLMKSKIEKLINEG